MSKVKEFIEYYEKKIDRFKNDEEKVLDSILKLSRINVTAENLQETGIYNVMKYLSGRGGQIGQKALEVYRDWKQIMSVASKERQPSEKMVTSAAIEKESLNHSDRVARDIINKPHHSSSNILSKSRPKDPSWHRQQGALEHSNNNDHHKVSFDSLRTSDSFSERDHSGHKLSGKYKDLDATKSFHSKPLESSSSSKHEENHYFKRGNHHRTNHLDSSKLNVHSHQLDFTKHSNHHPAHHSIGGGSHHPDASLKVESAHLQNQVRDSTHHGNSNSFHQDQQTHRDSSLHGNNSQSHPNLSSKDTANHSATRHHQDLFKEKNHHGTKGNTETSRDSLRQNGEAESGNFDIDSEFNPHLKIDDPIRSKLLDGGDEASGEHQGSKNKVLEPYSIELKEGMFRVVKIPQSSPNNFTPDMLKARLNYHKNLIMNSVPYEQDLDVKRDSGKSTSSRPHSGQTTPLESSPKVSKKSKKHSSPKVSTTPDSKSLKRKSSPLVDKTLRTPEKKRLNLSPNVSAVDSRLHSQKSFKESPSHVKSALDTFIQYCDKKPPKNADLQEDAQQFMCSKKERRSIYSGKKAAQDVLSLKHQCVRVLKKNVDYLKSPHEVSYDLLKPVLENCNPSQLQRVEEFYRHIRKSTNELWKQHCNKEYRGCIPMKHETWKMAYFRAQREQKKKFENLKASISASKHPERQVKVTLVDSGRDPHRKRVKIDSPQQRPHPSGSPVVMAAAPSKSSESPKKPKQQSLPPQEAPKPILHLPKPPKKVEAPLMSKVKKAMSKGLFQRNK